MDKAEEHAAWAKKADAQERVVDEPMLVNFLKQERAVDEVMLVDFLKQERAATLVEIWESTEYTLKVLD